MNPPPTLTAPPGGPTGRPPPTGTLPAYGPYIVQDVLQAGGMGVVVRARHETTGQLVALKTVPVHRASSLSALRREIHSLASLDHPGVVRIIEQGTEQGLPWYAMEIIVGGSLRRRIDDWTVSRPPPLLERLAPMLAVCDALAYIHGEGVVHRDLKPDNILLRETDGAPILIDFGLTTRISGELGRDALDFNLPGAGTVQYIAPEQSLDEVIDARADLYALGCMLYLLVTGASAFPGASWSRKLYDPAPAPSRKCPEVPPELDALILHLLERRPERRMGHASDVARVLRRIGVTPSETAMASGGSHILAARPYLYRPALVGQVEHVTRIEERIGNGRAGALIVIAGESGAGKTRLAMEVARQARRRSIVTMSGECVAVSTGEPGTQAVRGAPLHPFADVLQMTADRCQVGGPQITRALLGGRARVLAQFVPLIAAVPAFDQEPALEILSAAAARERVIRALHATLLAVAQEAPLLLVLEDVQWADELTLAWLQLLREGRLRCDRLTVICTYRTEDESAALREALGPASAGELRIGRLGADAVATMVADMLSLDVAPPEIARTVADHSEGNPLFVTEYMRAALADGLLRRGDDGTWALDADPDVPLAAAESLAMPGALRAYILRRLSLLSPGARALGQAASVVGRELDADLLVAMVDLSERALLDAMHELIARQVFEEAAPGRLRFIHGKLREVFYDEIPADLRPALHRTAAEAFERMPPERLKTLHGTVAHHFTVAGEAQRAASHHEQAADESLAIGSWSDVAMSMRSALALAGSAPANDPFFADRARRGGWWRRLGQALLSLGQLTECDGDTRTALALLGAPPPSSTSGWTWLLLRQIARQVGHLVLPSWTYERPGQRLRLAEAAQAAAMVSRLAFFKNDALRMICAGFLAVNLAERAGGGVQAARNYAGLGFLCGFVGLKGLSRRYYARGRRVAEETADWSGVLVVLTTEALHRIGEARWEEAEALLHEAEPLCDKTGDAQDRELVWTLLGHPAHYRGRFENAIAFYDRALASARERNNPQTAAWALYCTARTRIDTGDLAGAIVLLDEARTLLASQPDEMSEIATLGLLARAHALQGTREEAREIARLAAKRLDRAQSAVFLIGYGVEGVAEAALLDWRNGDAKAARTARRAARRLRSLARTFPVWLPAASRLEERIHLAGGEQKTKIGGSR